MVHQFIISQEYKAQPVAYVSYICQYSIRSPKTPRSGAKERPTLYDSGNTDVYSHKVLPLFGSQLHISCYRSKYNYYCSKCPIIMVRGQSSCVGHRCSRWLDAPVLAPFRGAYGPLIA